VTYHINPLPGDRVGRKQSMLSKVLHILPRPILESLAKDYVGGETADRPWATARHFLEERISHAATPEMREEIAEYLHKQLCPPCVTKDI
jgi:hypothetical protein